MSSLLYYSATEDVAPIKVHVKILQLAKWHKAIIKHKKKK